MAEREAPSWEEIRGLIERVDEVCQEAERVRDRANDSMRERPFWPERRRTARPAKPRDPDIGKTPT
jgi:hypothetical protein